ncbi:MAG: hypothetical protein LBN95_09300 [Prevotellaceae bacterium]|jgi:hypothetical protein|nr:hypothetical protein [Prevotellaceae bacterium]
MKEFLKILYEIFMLFGSSTSSKTGNNSDFSALENKYRYDINSLYEIHDLDVRIIEDGVVKLTGMVDCESKLHDVNHYFRNRSEIKKIINNIDVE